MCLVGYIASRSPGFKALQNLIATTWHCEAFLTIHASGWLIFKFANDADKLNVLSEGALILFMVGLSSSGQCQNILISLSQKCALFQFGLSFPIFHSSAGPLNVCLRLPVFLVSPFKVTCLPLQCLDSLMLGCWWKSTCCLTCRTPLKLLCQMVACSINKLYMKPFLISASIAKPLVITCTKSLPPIVPEQQQTPAHTPPPKERDSVFHQLGSQVDNPVVDRSKANLPADCVPTIK
jgi:hypothetical protein